MKKTFTNLYMVRTWNTLDSSNNNITVKLVASLRVGAEWFANAGFINSMGFYGTVPPPPSSDQGTVYDTLQYFNCNAASRNGWVNQVGWTMVKLGQSPTKEEKEETQLRANYKEFETSVWYTLGRSLNEVANVIYSTTWIDNEDPNISYRAKPGSVHEIKHRKSTSYL